MSDVDSDSNSDKKLGCAKTTYIDGVVIQGHQIASGKAQDSPYPGGSIVLQMPHFKKLGLDLSGFYSGTLNISITPKSFAILKPDYRFEQVHWIDGLAAETFSFCQCNVYFEEAMSKGFVYYPHPETKTQHFHNDSLIEVICEELAGIEYGDKVKLELSTEQINIF